MEDDSLNLKLATELPKVRLLLVDFKAKLNSGAVTAFVESNSCPGKA